MVSSSAISSTLGVERLAFAVYEAPFVHHQGLPALGGDSPMGVVRVVESSEPANSLVTAAVTEGTEEVVRERRVGNIAAVVDVAGVVVYPEIVTAILTDWFARDPDLL